jgi:gliding motility-associated-like protein
MTSSNLHNDPFFDAFKKALDDYQPDLTPKEINKDWSSFKSQVKISNPIKPHFGLKGIVITSVSSVAIITATLVYLNLKTAPEKLNPKTDQIIYTDSLTSIDKTATPAQESALKVQENTIHNSNDNNKQDQTGQKNTTYSTPAGYPTNNLSTQIIPKNFDNQNADLTKFDKPEKIPETPVSFGDVIISDTIICATQTVRVTYNPVKQSDAVVNIEFPDRSTNDLHGTTSYRFSKPGNWYITIIIRQGNELQTRKVKITVKKSLKAEFVYNASEAPQVKFYNRTKDASLYYWIFGDNNTDRNENPVHQYSDSGVYKVTYITFDDNGCGDTIVKNLNVKIYPEVDIPNTFTPNNDGINDNFIIKLNGVSFCEMKILDRYYNVVFLSKNPDIKWDGKDMNTHKECISGTYYFFLNYQYFGQDNPITKFGTISLFR